MRITILSPYHSGSHKAWAGGYRQHSAHVVSLLTMTGAYWKWRMHGAAVTLAREFLAEPGPAPDVLVATDMLDLAAFLALTRRRTAHIPVLLYMHENQLTYPLPADPTTGPMRRQLGERDRHYAFINYTSMLAADVVCFNSAHHLDSFFEELPRLLKHYPDYNELETVDALRAKSRVLPVGIDLKRLDGCDRAPRGREPLILWNQRWEYDKAPEVFLAALQTLAEDGLAFRVAVCGERFGLAAAEVEAALAPLGTHLIHNGYADHDVYCRLLHEADIVVSTARHEFFGISITEAIACGAFPILPNRLSYPEIIPAEFHANCLYADQADLISRLRRAIMNQSASAEMAQRLAPLMRRYDWTQMAPIYDRLLTDLAQSNSGDPGRAA